MPTDAEALAEHVAALKAELEQAEAAAAAAAPPAPEPPAAPAEPEPVEPAAPVEEPPASNLPGGTDSAPVAPAPEAPAEPTASTTPVLEAWVEQEGEGAVGKVRKLATKLLDEGKILEGDLLTPGESGAVNSVLVKAIDELISKVGL